MSLILTVPEVPPPLDTVRIEGFSVEQINDPANGPSVNVRITRGTTTGAVYTITEETIIKQLDVAAVIARMTAPIPAGSTLYAEIKAALYDLLVAGGHIGAGTVT